MKKIPDGIALVQQRRELATKSPEDVIVSMHGVFGRCAAIVAAVQYGHVTRSDTFFARHFSWEPYA